MSEIYEQQEELELDILDSDENDGRSMASIRQIGEIRPIPGADNIQQAQVDGWWVTVKKGEFTTGDYCVFFEVDSILPEVPSLGFMEKSKFRVKTMRLRGVISQGLAMPLSILNDWGRLLVDIPGKQFVFEHPEGRTVLEVDTDLTSLLGVKKYDPQGESLRKGNGEPKAIRDPQFKGNWFTRNLRKYKFRITRSVKKLLGLYHEPKPFPTNLIAKTDETRVQNYKRAITANVGKLFHEEEKMEGTSVTFIMNKSSFRVCSRNQDVTGVKNIYNQMAKTLDIKEKLSKLGRNLGVQGEIIGPGIQGNIYGLTEHQFRLFYVWDLDTRERLNRQETEQVANSLLLLMVPIRSREFIMTDNIDELVKHVSVVSTLNPKTQQEGSVFKLVDPDGRTHFSFKVINPLYELQKQKKELS